MTIWFVIYGVGWVVCALAMQRNWMNHFGRDQSEQFEGALWGMIGGFIWPVFALGAVFMLLGKWVNRG